MNQIDDNNDLYEYGLDNYELPNNYSINKRIESSIRFARNRHQNNLQKTQDIKAKYNLEGSKYLSSQIDNQILSSNADNSKYKKPDKVSFWTRIWYS